MKTELEKKTVEAYAKLSELADTIGKMALSENGTQREMNKMMADWKRVSTARVKIAEMLKQFDKCGEEQDTSTSKREKK